MFRAFSTSSDSSCDDALCSLLSLPRHVYTRSTVAEDLALALEPAWGTCAQPAQAVVRFDDCFQELYILITTKKLNTLVFYIN